MIAIQVSKTPETIDGTRFSPGPSAFILGEETETFGPATRDPRVEVDGAKEEGGGGPGPAAGAKRNETTSAGADAGVGSAPMSGSKAGGRGATTHGAGGNVGPVAPFSNPASRTRGDDVDLWLRAFFFASAGLGSF